MSNNNILSGSINSADDLVEAFKQMRHIAKSQMSEAEFAEFQAKYVEYLLEEANEKTSEEGINTPLGVYNFKKGILLEYLLNVYYDVEQQYHLADEEEVEEAEDWENEAFDLDEEDDEEEEEPDYTVEKNLVDSLLDGFNERYGYITKAQDSSSPKQSSDSKETDKEINEQLNRLINILENL